MSSAARATGSAGSKARAPMARSPMKARRSRGEISAGRRSARAKLRSISNMPQPSGRASAIRPGRPRKQSAPVWAPGWASGNRNGESSSFWRCASSLYSNRIGWPGRPLSASVPSSQRSPQPA